MSQVLLKNERAETVGRIMLRDGTVTFSGNSAEYIRDKMFVRDPDSGDRSWPTDGINYLRAVVTNLSRSPYLYAVMDSDDNGVPDVTLPQH